MTTGDRPVVLTWTRTVLPGSETFIRNQTDALARWAPTLVGALSEPSPLIRESDLVLFGERPFDRLAWKLLFRFGRSRRLRKLIRDTRPDLVHAHFLTNGWTIAHAARAAGLPLVVTAHGADVSVWPSLPGRTGQRARRQARKVIEVAQTIIAVSSPVRDQVIALGARPDKVVVHHIGIPILPVSASETNHEWDVMFIGRFTEKKGILDLIGAIGLLSSTRQLKVALIGDGPLAEAARSHASCLTADIRFFGSLPPAEVHSLLRRARMLVVPSRTAPNGDQEGLPTVILEAAAASLPVVATLHSGIPEAVIHEQTGLLCAEGNRADLAANIERLLDDPKLALAYGRNGRRLVQKSFDISIQTQELEFLYDAARQSGPA